MKTYPLSHRQVDTLSRLARGMTVQQIADEQHETGRAVYARLAAVCNLLHAKLATVVATARAAGILREDGQPAGQYARLSPVLTNREFEVLSGMSHGRSNSEIGRDLGLSEDTVKTYARRLFKALGAADRAHAVGIAFRLGVLRQPAVLSPALVEVRARLLESAQVVAS